MRTAQVEKTKPQELRLLTIGEIQERNKRESEEILKTYQDRVQQLRTASGPLHTKK